MPWPGLRFAGRHARLMLTVAPPSRRWPVAAKAAAAAGIPLAVATAAGHQQLGLTCTLGAFTVLFGPTTAARFRARVLAAAGAGLVAAATLGAVTQAWAWLHLCAVVIVAIVAAMVCVALKVGPPGSYFFTLTVGVSGYLVGHGHPVWQVVASVAVGAAVAWLVGMSDVLVSPCGAEKRAVAAADEAIACYEAIPSCPAAGDQSDPSLGASSGESEAFAAARTRASAALHTAWITITDGAGRRALSEPRRELAEQLRDLHERYIRRTALATHTSIPAPPARHCGGDDRGDPAVDVARTTCQDIELEQLRETSLGRPSPTYLLRSALDWPHEVPLVGLRVGLATLFAGLLAMALGQGHLYWAVAFAALVLHQGGTRIAQTYRGLQRLLGTTVGLGVFMVLLWIDPKGWWLVLALVTLQFGVEMLVVRNYALATMLITPLALTIAYVGAGVDNADVTVQDRFADTVIAVIVALTVLWLTGRQAPLLIFRAQGRRCIVAMKAVMADLAAGSVDTAPARERRRQLYFELLEYETVGGHAARDDPRRISPYVPMRAAVIELGYVVLAACWHPTLRRAAALFEEARKGFAPITAAPVTQPRDATEIHEDVLTVHRLITDWTDGR